MTLRALGGVAVLLLLAGCGAPDLPRRFVVNDSSWSASAPVAALAPGDVIYLGTWISGPVQDTKADYPPLLSTERLPLRRVTGRLLPIEAALLGSVLATHRVALNTTPALAQAIDRQQAALWNALMPSLRLVKDSATQPIQLRVDEQQFCRAFAGGRSGHDDRTLILSSYFQYSDGTCASNQVSDLRMIPQLEKPLAPLTETTSGMQGGFYRSGNKTVAISRVEVELGGAAMSNRDGLEARWSLAEWEAARICKDESGNQLAITRLELGEFQHRSLRVVGSEEPAEIEIVADRQQGRIVTQNPDLRGIGTLSRASLRLLHAADARKATWGENDWSLDPRLRPACSAG